MRLEPLAALTRRPLPLDDAAVDALSPGARATLTDSWQRRARAEASAAATFEYITAALVELSAAATLIALARRASDDERRHAEICARVAARYGDRQVQVPPVPSPGHLPEHPGADARLLRVLHVLGQCACNETVATAFLEAGLAAAGSPLPRAATRELLADDVDHARLGWAFLATLDDSTRAGVAGRLPRLCAQNLISWRKRIWYPPSPEHRAHGLLPWGEVDAIVLGATRDLVLRGFAASGFDVAPALSWLDGEDVRSSPDVRVGSDGAVI